jgi:hypothetical protein
MLKFHITTIVLLFLALCFTATSFAEGDPTMHEVYLAAEAGRFNEAQSMMDKVLRDHPNSAKAHFVEAELLAKQGLFSNADIELDTAERLQPGLSFVKPETVQNLKKRISSVSNGAMQPNNIAVQNIPSSVKNWNPSILLILGLGLIVLLIWFMSRRKSTVLPANNYADNARGQNMPPVGANGFGSTMGQPPVTGGMGSGIMGSLATGAAMGAGVVAGEALMHRFIDRDKNNAISESPLPDASPWNMDSNMSDNDDMGGSDFGVEDTASWDDDVANDGGDDWT